MWILKINFIVLAQFYFFSICLIGQEKIEGFKVSNGSIFSRHQRDSIESLGNFIGVKETIETKDSIVYTIFYYDKKFQLTTFQKFYVDKNFPEFKGETLEGNNWDTKELSGKVSMINFWSTSCGVCVSEMPQLNELREKYKNTVQFIAIAPENQDEIKSFLERFKFDFTIVLLSKEKFNQLGIKEYPKTFFIDKKGIVKIIDEGVPVDLKLNPNGLPREPGDSYKILAFQNYSKIIDGLINEKIYKK